MAASPTAGDEQVALWNGASGQSWVEAQELLDEMFAPFEELLVESADTKPRRRVLDVGCGTGSTTLAIKRRLGPEAECVGIDISQPMLERARARAKRARVQVNFLCANAEEHAFDQGSFDLITSRFGVMFFTDSIRAFENLRRSASENADLCLIAWRSVSENPFMTTAERAVAAILPGLAGRDLDGPGQFRFAESKLVRHILERSGWGEIEIHPIDVECRFPEAELMHYVTRLGPLGRAMRESDEETKARLITAVRPAFAPYVEAGVVRFSAACWKIGARASSTPA